LSPSLRKVVWAVALAAALISIAVVYHRGSYPPLATWLAVVPVPLIALIVDRSAVRAAVIAGSMLLAMCAAAAWGAAMLPAAGAAALMADRFGRNEDAARIGFAFAAACAVTMGMMPELRLEISVPLLIGALSAVLLGLGAPAKAPAGGFDRWSPAIFWCLASGTFCALLELDSASERFQHLAGAIALAMIAGWLAPVSVLATIASALLAASTLPPLSAVVLAFVWGRSATSLAEIRAQQGTSIPAALATCFGAGYTPKGSGTAGAVTAIPFGWWLAQVDPIPRALILTAATGLSIAVAYWYMAGRKGDLDPKEVVLDEHIGVLIAFAVVPWEWPWVAAAFGLFRLFDIWKPWPVGWLDRTMKNPAGVMLDDVAAGLMAAGLLLAARLVIA
jgi:phosphatidylglycerophosphatase A